MAQQRGNGLGNLRRISRIPARYPTQVAVWWSEKSSTATLEELTPRYTPLSVLERLPDTPFQVVNWWSG
ncbi:Uncharacterized protein APZ42_003011 [Daphnia magna]|uniref:Uncharacterized protein n=1 Tax=Daphnia magna TaxID=35525 RepID=A0A164HWB2_9CRUS|nr:Uncharacterized protein APZ42_003011 [Daphnia magna]